MPFSRKAHPSDVSDDERKRFRSYARVLRRSTNSPVITAPTSSVPKPARDRWLAKGALAPVHSRLGEAMLCFENDDLYDPRSGLRVLEPDYRSAASNVME